MNPQSFYDKLNPHSKDRLHEAKHMHEVYDAALTYIKDRATGHVGSLLTPWPKFNACGIKGLEWGTLLTIGARPGAGKTMIVSQLLREARALNPTQDFNILEFQFEMGSKQYGAREFAAQMSMDYSSILSVPRSLDKFTIEQLGKIKAEAKAMAEVGIFRMQINKALTPAQIEEGVRKYYDQLGNKPLLVTIDHSWLIQGAKGESKFDILYKTAEMLMQLKNQLPVIFIMLTQLNREIDSDKRKEPGKLANYPNSSDIFGGDALMQASDMVVALNNPYKAGIYVYGPENYQCTKTDIFMHLLKVRNAKLDDDVLFMQAQFEKGKLVEGPEPPRVQMNTGKGGAKLGSRLNGFLNNPSTTP